MLGQLDQILSKVMGLKKSYNTVKVLLCIVVREWQSSTLCPALSPLVGIPTLCGESSLILRRPRSFVSDV